MDESLKTDEEQVSWKKRFRRELRIGAAVVLIVVGLVGIVVPVMPGWTPLAFGIVLLVPRSRFSRWVRGRLRDMRRRRWERKQNAVDSGKGSGQGKPSCGIAKP